MKQFILQIATNKEQSDRLIDLRVNSNTCDLLHLFGLENPPIIRTFQNKCNYPAWSLSRLLEMIPTNINGYILEVDFENKGISYSKTNCCDKLDWLYIRGYENLFDGLIDCIEWLINNMFFNKEFLE